MICFVPYEEKARPTLPSPLSEGSDGSKKGNGNPPFTGPSAAKGVVPRGGFPLRLPLQKKDIDLVDPFPST